MYKLFLSISLFICSLLAGAQNMSVVSFQLNEQDLTANQQGTIVFDQNGEKCALIKIFTTETGFTFDVGSLGVAKTEQKVGEIWVYVPHSIKKINLSHPILQRLEYSIPIPIVKARTYEMRLTSDEGKTIIKRPVRSQYVLFKVSPQDALVELDGQTLAVTDGTATKRMPFGTYSYRVQAPRHAVKSGTIVVNDPKNKHIVNITLEPQYVNAKFSVANNAEIWIDEQKRGTGSCTLELGYGTYLVECRLPGHKPSQQEILITQESVNTPITLPPPTPIYGSLDINSSPADAEVWLDDKQVGTTPLFLSECLVGEHKLKVSKSGFKNYTKTITVVKGQTETEVATLEEELSINGISPTNKVTTDAITFTVNGVSFEMVFVEGGTFQRGATKEQKGWYKEEKPVHNVTLSDFYIGKTEVTQALWEAVMGSNGSNPHFFKGKNLPMVCNWDECQEFIKKLNFFTGRNFQLPTEAEWEYAARGGKNSNGYKYSGSDDLGLVAWYRENSDFRIHPIATKLPNELGLYDMSGNVRELCQDFYAKYSNSHKHNPQGPNSGNFKVIRGGNIYHTPRLCRVSCRRLSPPSDVAWGPTGFRLCLPVIQISSKK